MLRKFLDRMEPHFEKGGKLEKLYPVYEVMDSFFYGSRAVTSGSCHVRDALEFKRMMSTVLVGLIPVAIMAMYNTGLQANTTLHAMVESGVSGVSDVLGWRHPAQAPAETVSRKSFRTRNHRCGPTRRPLHRGPACRRR